MRTDLLVVLIGLVGGVAIGIQSPIGGAMGQRVGATASSFIVHFSGMALSGLLLFVRGGERIRDWQSLPWYMLGAGVFGLILYQTISITFPRLGGTAALALIITGQLLIGLVIDHFGWFGVTVRQIEPTRLAGIAILLIGCYLLAK